MLIIGGFKFRIFYLAFFQILSVSSALFSNSVFPNPPTDDVGAIVFSALLGGGYSSTTLFPPG